MPVKNEVLYIEKALLSIINQPLTPIAFFIFDDDSTDGTTELLNKFCAQYSWIALVKVPNFRPDLVHANSRIPAIFNYVYSFVEHDYDFLIKLDADIEFGLDFIQTIFNAFKENPKLGIASGRCSFNGKLESIVKGSTRGATKFYKKECFLEIGEKLYEKRGNDIMDNITARYFGWQTETIDVEFKHLKKEGIKTNIFYSNYETGFYKGTIPYFAPYFLLTLIKAFVAPPIILSSFIQLSGYINARLLKKERWLPVHVSKQLINEQKAKILLLFKDIFK